MVVDLISQDLPRVYRLHGDGIRLVVEVDRRYRDFLVANLHEDRFNQAQTNIGEQNQLEAFQGSLAFSGRWGFGGVLHYDAGDPWSAWSRFTAEIPRVQINAAYEWKQAFHVCHSLQALFEILSTEPCQAPSAKYQSMYVALVTGTGIHGGIIAADVSPSMVEWLVRAFDGDIQYQVEQVMRQAHRRLLPEWEHHLGIDCRMSHDTLQMKSGGSGSLGVIGCRKADPGRGFELQPHNCDTPLDQLVLLAGLAKLDQLFHER